MNKKIILLTCVIVILFAILSSFIIMPHDDKIEVELVANGTTIVVDNGTELIEHDEYCRIYETPLNTTITAIDNNNDIGAEFSEIITGLVVDTFEKQDNGLYFLDENEQIKVLDKLSFEYDENNIEDKYVGILNNKSINQTIIFIGADENEIINLMNSVKWGNGIVASNSIDDVEDSNTGTEPTVYAYMSDGTPMYSQSEVDYYMQSKYGDVDYHIKDNGYINIDNNEYLNPDGSLKVDSYYDFDDEGNYIGEY